MILRDLALGELLAAIRVRWLWLVAGALLGGLMGLGAHAVRPSLYEASSSLGVAIDYGRTIPLDANDERAALLQVQEVLLSDETLEATLDRLEASRLALGRPASVPALREAVRIEQINGRWDLYAQSPYPADAAVMADAWAEASLEAVEQALVHAWNARELQSLYYEVSCHLVRLEGETEYLWECAHFRPPTTEDLGGELLPELIEEVRLSRGLVPALSVGRLRQAAVPTAPIVRGRGLLTAAGVLTGFLVGLLVTLLVPYRRRGHGREA